jgi:hypothetical protein
MTKTIEYYKTILKNTGYWMAQITRQDDDILVVIDGDERSGKSSLAYWIAHYALEYQDREITPETYIWNGKQLVSEMYDHPPHTPIIFDEAGLDQYKYQSGSKLNVQIKQALMASAMRNQIIIYCVPHFWDLDEFIRNRRCRLWFRTKKIYHGGQVLRGQYEFHSGGGQPKYGNAKWWNHDANNYFPDMPPVFKREYKKRKSYETKKRITQKMEEADIGLTKKDQTLNMLALRKRLNSRLQKEFTDKEIINLLDINKRYFYQVKREYEKRRDKK